MEADFVFRTLDHHGVECVVIGGAAAWLHDRRRVRPAALEVCFRQVWDNCECLTRALEELRAVPIPPPAVPIPPTGELRSCREAMRFETPGGPLVLAPAVDGLGGYDDLLTEATVLDLEGLRLRVLSPQQLARCNPPDEETGMTGGLQRHEGNS